eukprot:1194611-Prorocentrum_minimum.AAC.1
MAKYTLTLLIGAITGCFAYLIGASVKFGIETKLEITDWMMFNFGLAWGFASHAAISITLVMGASCLVSLPLRVATCRNLHHTQLFTPPSRVAITQRDT